MVPYLAEPMTKWPISTHALELNGPDGASVRVTHKPRLITDDMAQLLHAALAGVGVVKLPSMVTHGHIMSGRLVNVTPGWTPRGGIVHAVFPTRRGLLPSVRSFIDFLATEYSRAKAGSPATTLVPWTRHLS